MCAPRSMVVDRLNHGRRCRCRCCWWSTRRTVRSRTVVRPTMKTCLRDSSQLKWTYYCRCFEMCARSAVLRQTYAQLLNRLGCAAVHQLLALITIKDPDTCRSKLTPPLFSAFIGMTPSEFRRDFWNRQQTRVPRRCLQNLYVKPFRYNIDLG